MEIKGVMAHWKVHCLGVSFNSWRVITKSKPEYSKSLSGFEPNLLQD
jgi:hypothetical protein